MIGSEFLDITKQYIAIQTPGVSSDMVLIEAPKFNIKSDIKLANVFKSLKSLFGELANNIIVFGEQVLSYYYEINYDVSLIFTRTSPIQLVFVSDEPNREEKFMKFKEIYNTNDIEEITNMSVIYIDKIFTNTDDILPRDGICSEEMIFVLGTSKMFMTHKSYSALSYQCNYVEDSNNVNIKKLIKNYIKGFSICINKPSENFDYMLKFLLNNLNADLLIFAKSEDENRIKEIEYSLNTYLEDTDINLHSFKGKSFLDCGDISKVFKLLGPNYMSFIKVGDKKMLLFGEDHIYKKDITNIEQTNTFKFYRWLESVIYISEKVFLYNEDIEHLMPVNNTTSYFIKNTFIDNSKVKYIHADNRNGNVFLYLNNKSDYGRRLQNGTLEKIKEFGEVDNNYYNLLKYLSGYDNLYLQRDDIKKGRFMFMEAVNILSENNSISVEYQLNTWFPKYLQSIKPMIEKLKDKQHTFLKIVNLLIKIYKQMELGMYSAVLAINFDVYVILKWLITFEEEKFVIFNGGATHSNVFTDFICNWFNVDPVIVAENYDDSSITLSTSGKNDVIYPVEQNLLEQFENGFNLFI